MSGPQGNILRSYCHKLEKRMEKVKMIKKDSQVLLHAWSKDSSIRIMEGTKSSLILRWT